jgi:hypothetical protein
MAIDIGTEQLLTLPQAAATLPGRPNVCTIFRWVQRGVKNVRLETVKIGGRRYTSAEALQRFAQQCSAVREGQQPEPAPVVLSAQRRKQIENARRILDEAGIR